MSINNDNDKEEMTIVMMMVIFQGSTESCRCAECGKRIIGLKTLQRSNSGSGNMDIKGQTRKGDQGELEEYGDIALPLSSGFKYQATSEKIF